MKLVCERAICGVPRVLPITASQHLSQLVDTLAERWQIHTLKTGVYGGARACGWDAPPATHVSPT